MQICFFAVLFQKIYNSALYHITVKTRIAGGKKMVGNRCDINDACYFETYMTFFIVWNPKVDIYQNVQSAYIHTIKVTGHYIQSTLDPADIFVWTVCIVLRMFWNVDMRVSKKSYF